ncbi:hypothetical protein ASPWEDRAFT_179408 [Aspergillus wentii DTO 134E9]|uniref:Uncharacterized protein n=1 Tax=Aspergillus wentii DTO 134E9 TaxID=1073089 RepID=A0A1L9S3G3_ASPWE|nr:uncharacterized protein ASPWEDRAFT_179408 [Aspergillus wentii DTO 134E9]OJJ41701.1 hypothetical protein ASPWEDRAFT_179408 [Aspergillus wentii DTO 134E9]
MEEHGIMSGLPNDYALVHFHRFQQIKTATKQVFDALAENGGGNQFVVVLGLPETARRRLDTEKNCLDGISFRFMWENYTGLIKVIPSAEHDFTTGAIRTHLERMFTGMGIARDEVGFAMSTTHKPAVGNRGKQADECFWPLSRQPRPGRAHGWPTLVIETGVSESLRRLREDACWWFHNSLGDVRIVLIVCINRRTRKILVEKWQLAPAGTPNPMTRNMRIQLSNPNQQPPLGQQPVASQQPYAAQEIEINSATVQGAPLILNFEAVLDRPRQGNESDLVFNTSDLLYCARMMI